MMMMVNFQQLRMTSEGWNEIPRNSVIQDICLQVLSWDVKNEGWEVVVLAEGGLSPDLYMHPWLLTPAHGLQAE